MIDEADLHALSEAAADISSRPRYRVVGDAAAPAKVKAQPAPRQPVSESTFEALAYALRGGVDTLDSDRFSTGRNLHPITPQQKLLSCLARRRRRKTHFDLSGQHTTMGLK